MEISCTTQTALVLAGDICIRTCVRVPHVAAATIRGWSLIEKIRYHHHYGICKTFVVAAAATVYQEPHF